MRVTGAIFDMDGTLVDSMPFWDTIGEQYLQNRGIEPKPDLKERLQSMSLHQAAYLYQSEYGLTESTEEIVDGVKQMLVHFYTNVVELKEGVKDVLEILHSHGVKMCVATATDKSLAKAALKRKGVMHYFGKIFTCDELECGKDEPKIYRVAHDFLGTPKSTTWVFEDALYAAKTVKTANFPLVGIYDAAEQNKQELQHLADIYIHNFREMEDLLHEKGSDNSRV